MSPFSLAPAAALALTLPAAAQLVVDAAGGTPFTQIQPAIAAALPDQTIFVRGGTYRSFVLDKPLRIVARGTVIVDSGSIVHSIPAGRRVALRNMMLGNLQLLGCDGLIVADEVGLVADYTRAGPNDTTVLEIAHCADVRMRQLGINPGAETSRDGVRVIDSHVAFDGASIDGASGEIGGWGLRCEQNSVVHVSFGRVRGGNATLIGAGIAGGIAVGVDATSRYLHDGTGEDEIRGGHGSYCGRPGAAIFVDAGGEARIARRVRVSSGLSPCLTTAPIFGAGTVTVADPADLAMFFRGAVGNVGVPTALTFVGEPGDAVALLIGVDPLAFDLPGVAHRLLVAPLAGVPVGVIANDGTLIVVADAPALVPGDTVLLQAAAVRAGAGLLLSNTTALVSD